MSDTDTQILASQLETELAAAIAINIIRVYNLLFCFDTDFGYVSQLDVRLRLKQHNEAVRITHFLTTFITADNSPLLDWQGWHFALSLDIAQFENKYTYLEIAGSLYVAVESRKFSDIVEIERLT